jgi:ubiquinone/menaquinone biosynthesis C-methylase UbiE
MATAPQPGDGVELFDFDQAATTWDTLYDASDFTSIAYYRSRLERTLAWVDDLALPAGSRVLEIGFGAGRTAVALAERGLQVTGIDSGERMLEVASQRVARAGLAGRIELAVGDAEEIAAADASFDLVLALGVMPWLDRPARGVREMGRVTRPGGHVIASVNNRRQLNRVLDPRLHPLVAPAKRLALQVARRGGRDLRPVHKVPRPDSRRRYERWLRAAGLEPERFATLGFGEFSLLGRVLMSQPASIRLNERLQARADAGFPLLRAGGAQMLVLSRKGR